MWLKLPDVIIWIIVTKYLKMWDTLNLRLTCKKMRNATRHPFLKSLWNIKKKQLEEQFVENRSKMLRGWMRAKPKIDKNKQKLILREETRDLFEAMKENFKLSRRLKWINGEYNQKGLEKFGFGVMIPLPSDYTCE